MIVLALDTTTRHGSCALARDGATLIEQTGDPRRSQAERLPGDLMSLLASARVTLGEIDVFSVAVGPGSFTGLRVGIAAMQGLAFAMGKPLVGVSALDALARLADAPRVLTWVDAWRGEVYSALYEQGRAAGDPVVARPRDILDALDPGPVLLIGDGALAHRDVTTELRAVQPRVADPAAPPLAGIVARLATEAARSGHAPPPHAIRPLYVRRPDAELARRVTEERRP